MKLKNSDLQGLKNKLNAVSTIASLAIGRVVLVNHTTVDKATAEMNKRIGESGINDVDDALRDEIGQCDEFMSAEISKYGRNTKNGIEIVDKKGWEKAKVSMIEKFPLGGKFYADNEVRITAILDEDIEIEIKKIGVIQYPATLCANEIFQLGFMTDSVSLD